MLPTLRSQHKRVFPKYITPLLVGISFYASAHALTLEAALNVVDGYAPEIRAAQAGQESAQATLIAAGALPDPKISISLNDFALDGSNRFRADEGVATISIMQDFPNKDKRQAERLLAQADAQTSLGQSHYARLNARREATFAWLELYYLKQKETVLTQQEEENLLKLSSAKAALAGGVGTAESALAAQIERAAIADARDELAQQTSSAQARLARWVGKELAAQGVSGDLPQWLDEEHGFKNIEGLPEVRTAQAQATKAQAELAMAIAEKKSDWELEVGVGRDGMGKPMGMVKVTFALPIFTSTRQNPRISAASSSAARAHAEQEAMRANYHLQFNELLAQRTALAAQLQRLTQQTLPLLNQQINLALAAMGGGQGSVDSVFLVRNARLTALLRQADLESQQALLNAKLYFLTGGGNNE